MTELLSKTQFDESGWAAFRQSRNEPHWLSEQRQASWEIYQSLQWPDRRSEDWMRSDLRAFKIDNYVLPTEQPESLPEVPVRLASGIEAAGSQTVLDAWCVSESLDPELAKRGVVFGSLERCALEHSELVKKHLFKTVAPSSDRFTALHAAAWTGGHFLYVPRGVKIANPLHVLAGISDGGTDLGHTLIVLEEGAEATFLYESSSPFETAAGFHCGALEIIVGTNARLRYVNLQDWGRNVWHFAHQRATVGSDASLQWTIAAMGAKFAQVSQQVALVGKGANCQVNGVLFTQDRQQLTYNTLQHHISPHCRSDFLYKSALQDRSRTVWRGMIRVDKQAQRTDGYQRNDNLLLSDQARADSIPGLEILADDVRCTHGSTSGKVDEEIIFYAQSRGFTRREAVRMIVTGFFQQIFDRISIESVRDALGAAIARQVREYV